MNRIRKAAQERRVRRDDHRNSIHFAIANATTDRERNELMQMASDQGVSI